MGFIGTNKRSPRKNLPRLLRSRKIRGHHLLFSTKAKNVVLHGQFDHSLFFDLVFNDIRFLFIGPQDYVRYFDPGYVDGIFLGKCTFSFLFRYSHQLLFKFSLPQSSF